VILKSKLTYNLLMFCINCQINKLTLIEQIQRYDVTKNVSALVSSMIKYNTIRVYTLQRQWYVLDYSKELKRSKI